MSPSAQVERLPLFRYWEPLAGATETETLGDTFERLEQGQGHRTAGKEGACTGLGLIASIP